MDEATTGRANVMNLTFRPENEFLEPYVAAASTLSRLLEPVL